MFRFSILHQSPFDPPSVKLSIGFLWIFGAFSSATTIYNCFYTSQRQTSEPHSHFVSTQFVTWIDNPPKNWSCLLFLNWRDLEGYFTTLKINSVAKQKKFRNMCKIHNVAWHAYCTCKYAGSYMHPVHDKQETSLNVRGSGDSQNLKGQEILRSLIQFFNNWLPF